MVCIITKKIKNKEYLYLVTSMREDGKIKKKTIKYIGAKRFISKKEKECIEYSYKNKDWILKNHDTLSYQDHNKLKELSNQYKKYIHSLDKVSKEKERERFLSIFIANSNAIEGSTLTVQETHNLLFNKIAPSKDIKDIFMATNMYKAWQYLEENITHLPTENDIKMLHGYVNQEIEEDATLGIYKQVQNYIGDTNTSSYLFTKEKMKQLLRWINNSYKTINDFEIAFQSHIQFEIIHPFIDGNGRVGRLLINWLLMHKKLQPIAIPIEERGNYIAALGNAQRGNVQAITEFLKKIYIQNYS